MFSNLAHLENLNKIPVQDKKACAKKKHASLQHNSGGLNGAMVIPFIADLHCRGEFRGLRR